MQTFQPDTLDDIDQYFAEFHTRREQQSAAFRAACLPHLQNGGVIRETGMGDPHDWKISGKPGGYTPESLTAHLDARRAGFGLSYEFLPPGTPAWMPPTPDGAHTLTDLRRMLADKGYTHYLNMNRQPIPLDDWDPYGASRIGFPWFGTLRDDDTVIDTPHNPPTDSRPFLLGVWHFERHTR
jgi:hypothetical protein